MRLTGLTPTEFSLLFSLAALLAVIFYLLSFRRRIAVVATDPIWRKVIGRKRTPFRKLLALLGQILILFMLCLALGDPRTKNKDADQPVAAAVIVDVSASMSAQESDGMRIEQATNLVVAIAELLGPRDRLMLLSMDDTCRPLTTFSSEVQPVMDALKKLNPTLMPEDVPAAIRFATAAFSSADISDESRKRIILISDRFHVQPKLDQGLELIQVAVGTVQQNVAVTALDVRKRTGAAKGSELFVEVTNYGAQPRPVRLSIHTPEVLLGRETIEIDGHDSVSQSYFLKPVESRQIMATLTARRSSASLDRFAADDRAYSLIPVEEDRRVVLVTAGNFYLEKALKLNPSVNVQIVKPEDFRAGLLNNALAVFFDGVCPAVDIPAAYFNPPDSPGCPFAKMSQVDFPELLPLRGDHPVSDGVSLVDVQIKAASRLKPVAGDVELLQDKQGPLLIARKIGGQRLLGVGFDLAQSDLPLRVAFPLLVQNCLDWFLGKVIVEEQSTISVGRLYALPEWVNSEAVITDSQAMRVFPSRIGEKFWLRPRQPGYYSVELNKNRLTFPVNFHSRTESDLKGDRRAGPNRLVWRQGDLPAVLVDGFDKTEYPEPPMQWPTLLLAAAWILLFDWMFFCFRILF